MQKTNFPFEVLIHDDASTDGTADIIREYEAKYPDIIKPIYQTENQYSSVHGNSPGKNTGVGCHFLLQGIFWTQGSKLCLLKFLQGNKAVLSHFTQISVSEIPFSTHVARN